MKLHTFAVGAKTTLTSMIGLTTPAWQSKIRCI